MSVHCDQCTDTPTGPGTGVHYPDQTTALDAALAAGWLIAPDGRLWCSACGPILICQAEGHEFTRWHPVRPAPGELPRICGCDPDGEVHLLGSTDCDREFRNCRRCCLHESRTVTPTAVA